MRRATNRRAAAANGGKKKWTFMVYLAGDNNLDDAGVEDLAEMKKVGSTDEVNVIAQFDRAAEGSATRYFLRRKTAAKADAVQKLGATNTGDPAALFDFVRWGVKQYPAERYALVLWNHGQGWDDTDIYANERGGVRRLLRPRRISRAFFRTSVERAARLTARSGVVARAILLDDGAKDFLDNIEMKKVLGSMKRLLGRKLDLLGMDACLMNMAEVAYQARGAVDYAVGSEETEPGDGWPYDVLLRALAADPSMTADALGRLIVTTYLRSYHGTGEAVTQSLLDLSTTTKVGAAVKVLAAALTAALRSPEALTAIVDARARVQQFYVRDNVDLIDLCRLLRERAVPEAVKSASDGVIASVSGDGALVRASGFVGPTMRNASGLAIYFPAIEVSPLYAKLDWTAATGWGAFLKRYLDAIQAR
ncbi:MAG TPA: clostripain-related cysteine peptidase [Anaeromyxobacter sp.]